MARTPPYQRYPSFKKYNTRSSWKSGLPTMKSPSQSKAGEFTRRLSTRSVINTSSTHHLHLPTLDQHPVSPGIGRLRSNRAIKYADQRNETYYDEQEGPANLDDDDGNLSSEPMDNFFCWEEEDTLFTDLMDEHPEAEDTRFDALAESLQDYFDAYGTNLKKETAAAFVPTVNKVKHIHGLLDKTIDRGFTNGLLKFDRICKDAELEAIRDHDELQATYKRGQARIDDLFTQLQEAYATRDRLWDVFEATISDAVKKMKEELEGLPVSVDVFVTELEQDLEKLEKAEHANLPDKKWKVLLHA